MIAPLLLRRWALIDVVQLAVPAFLLLAFTYTIADADLWGHLRFGADLLGGHGLLAHDPYSFTSDTPWINHEWLAEVVTAAFYGAAGAFGLNVLKLSVIGLVGALVWRAGRDDGGTPFSLVMLTGLVLFASYTRTQVLRPQLFSVLFFAVLMVLLRRRERGPGGSLLAVPTLFCVWANTHGGWIVGLAVLGIWTGAIVLERRSLTDARRRAVELLGAAAATLVNPYGIGLWVFLRQTVGLARDISDWTPFFRFPPALIAMELVLPLLAIVALRVSRRVPPLRHTAVLAALAFATCRIGRVDAFLQVATGLLLAPELIGLLRRVESSLRKQPRLVTPSRVHGAAALGLAAYALVVAASHVRRIDIAGTWIPDSEAVRFIQADSPNARLLTWFDWGEYAIWHLSPAGIKVSMDGRRETVYSDSVLAAHWAFYRNENEAWRYPGAIGANRIWLPKHFPVVPVLLDRGWRVAFENDVSVVLSADSGPASFQDHLDRGPRVFPGP